MKLIEFIKVFIKITVMEFKDIIKLYKEQEKQYTEMDKLNSVNPSPKFKKFKSSTDFLTKINLITDLIKYKSDIMKLRYDLAMLGVPAMLYSEEEILRLLHYIWDFQSFAGITTDEATKRIIFRLLENKGIDIVLGEKEKCNQ